MATRKVVLGVLVLLSLVLLIGCGSLLPVPYPDSYNSPDWSPDGSMIAYRLDAENAHNRLAIYYVDSGSSYTFSVTAEEAIDWFSDSDRLLICNNDGQYVYSIDSHEQVKVHDYRTDHAVVSPDSTQVLYEGEDGMICLYSLLDSSEEIIVEGNHPSWNPDGNSFAYMDPGYAYMCIYDLETDEVIKYLVREFYMNLAVSNNGEFIAFNLRENGSIFTFELASQEIKELTEFGANPSWSPDGTQIVFDGHKNLGHSSYIHVANVETGKIQQLVP